MKKIKKIWEENKVLLVLAIILLVCFAVVIIVGMTYFYGSNNNVYGNRLDATKDVPLSDKLLKDIKDEAEKSEVVKEANVDLRGLIVYISIKFKDDTKLDDAKKVADSLVELFNEDELKVYDLEFSLENDSEKGFTLMGARNSSGSGVIVWNNYNVEEEVKEEKKETKKDSKA